FAIVVRGVLVEAILVPQLRLAVQGGFEEAQADARLLGRDVTVAVEVEKFAQKVPVHARASPKKQYRINFDAATPFSCPRGGARKFDVGRHVDGRGGGVV